MFDTLIALFERLVIAHEKVAGNQAALLEFQKELVDMETTYVVADPQPTAAEPEKPKSEPKGKGKKKEEAPAPEAPKAEEPKPVEKPRATLADVKMAVSQYADSRLKGGSADPKGDARALMAHFGQGATKTDLIPEECWQDIIDACTSGWEPLLAKEEEL